MKPQYSWCLALLALTVTGPAPADDDTAASDLFGQTVEVRVVNVDVHVTDKKGRPVTGLTEDDFVLLADGRETEIAYFYASRSEGAVAAPDALADSVPLDVGGLDEVPALAAPRDDLLLVIYLDNYWLTPGERKRLLDDIERFMGTLTLDTVRFLLATHDPGLNLRTPVTRDPDVVLAALAAIPDLPTQGMQAVRERNRTYQSIETIYNAYRDSGFCGPCDCGFDEMVAVWQTYAQVSTHRLGVANNGMRELLSALSGIPDRKAVLYVAAGLMQRPGISILQYLAELCPLRQRDTQAYLWHYDESTTLLDLGAHANAARATFYPLDAGGLRADAAASVDWASAQFRPSALVTRIERANLEASLQILASATGGKAIFNANQPFEDLARLESDFRNVYSLGFTPSGAADSRKHRLEVELRNKRRGVRLRFRRSYVDKKLDRRLVDRAIAALTFAEESNPLNVEVRLGEPSQLGRNVVRFPVHVDVMTERLTLIQGADDTVSGRFRVFLAARTADGKRTALREKFFDVSPEAIAGGVHRIVINVNLEPGEYTIGVGVRDEIGAVTSYLAVRTADAGPSS